jgi:hypothetical protein
MSTLSFLSQFTNIYLLVLTILFCSPFGNWWIATSINRQKSSIEHIVHWCCTSEINSSAVLSTGEENNSFDYCCGPLVNKKCKGM